VDIEDAKKLCPGDKVRADGQTWEIVDVCDADGGGLLFSLVDSEESYGLYKHGALSSIE